MGMMGRLIGGAGAARSVGEAVGGVAEVFVGNRAAREAAEFEQVAAAVAQHGAEFAQPRGGWFDSLVNGLNRLPRPMMAIGTLGLFGYAMVSPEAFARRMEGLALTPEPLWWLLGAIVSFYFGARELHYRREAPPPAPARLAAAAPKDAAGAPPPQTAPARPAPLGAIPAASRAADPNFNAALEEWRGQRG